MDDDDRDADVQDDDDHDADGQDADDHDDDDREADVEDARKQVCKSHLIRSSMVALVQVAPKQISVHPGWRHFFILRIGWRDLSSPSGDLRIGLV